MIHIGGIPMNLALQLDCLIKRFFTKELDYNLQKTVYDLTQWKYVDVCLKDHKTGKTIFERSGLEFPEFYDQNSCDIIASKYFRKAGVNNGYGYERSMREVVHRMVGFWVDAAFEEGLIREAQKPIFYDELAYSMLHQMWAPNSPQWFNTGLNWAYGIQKEADGHFYFDERLGKVIQSKDAYTRTQGSACFIISVKDKLLGPHSITDQITTETRLFKQGSGTGTNFSNIRAKGEKLSGGGTSSGLMSFLKVFDRNAGAIKSGGVTRRAAKMVCLDADHPEILNFIEWKKKEEDKVRALGKMGYDVDFNGEAYETVSGQNANNSVRFSDDFMKKVLDDLEDDSWELTGRIDDQIDLKISARELWKRFNQASWSCADPAPQYHDIINAWHTCPAGEDGIIGAKHNEIRASNPCSEYHFLDDTACNLASINVLKFYNMNELTFDTAAYLHLIAFIQIVLEVTIFKGQFPTEDIARKSHIFRTTGLGVANTGALCMAMAYPYDSEQARNITAALVGIVTGYSYFISALMAEKVGTFAAFDVNRSYMLKVIRNHARAAGVLQDPFEELQYTPFTVNHSVLFNENFEYIGTILKDSWLLALEYGTHFGYRNAQVSVIAPTGTIALAMGCATTSIEPFYSHVTYKSLAGGGLIELVNPLIEVALTKLGYSKIQIQEIIDYVMKREEVIEYGHPFNKIIDGKIEGAPHLKEEHYSIFDTANQCGTGSRTISSLGHIRMLAALTPLVSGAISKTVNMPNSSTLEDVTFIHEEAYRLGVKCLAIYRDGCKASQVLYSTKNNEQTIQNEVETANKTSELYQEVVCTNCNSTQVVPSGSCSICLTCGTTTGCS